MPRAKKEECECGRPPVCKNVAREWVCADCRGLERSGKEIKGRYANKGRTKTKDLEYVPKEKKILNFSEMYDDALKTPLESLSRLESMLADPQRTLLTAFTNQV